MIEELSAINFQALFAWVFIILSFAVSITTLIGKVSEIIGRPVAWVRKRKEDHDLIIKTAQSLEILRNKEEEDVKQSIRHDDMIREDLAKLSDSINGITSTLQNMQERENNTELKKLKEKLVAYYNKYKNSDGWTELEKDAFWDLFEDYESRGGDGYMHTIVEPVMREMKIIE